MASLYGILTQIHDYINPSQEFTGITLGRVVDTNDPQQMGRVRAICASLGDDIDEENIEDVPWASYASPFAGSVSNNTFSRGTDEEDKDNVTDGHVAYGMWGIPKEGAIVLIMCVDGDPLYRVWVGCLYGQNLNNTLPHGRYSFDFISSADGKPDGPFSTSDEPIQPLYKNLTEAFGADKTKPEWRTRGADYSAAGIHNNIIIKIDESVDVSTPDEIGEHPGSYTDSTGTYTVTQGYANSRLNSDIEAADEEVTENYDSQTYSWTTPGFHSIAMDDRVENCRMRFRTTTGHQIVLDDTNERIYISTAEGNNWIEMDQNGNIDIHSERRISIHAAKDINFSTDETFRVHAKKGIHMYSGEETRIHSAKDINIRTEQNLRTHSAQQTFIESDTNMNLKTATEFRASSSSTMHFNSGGDMMLTGGPDIHLNGPTATLSEPAAETHSYWTNRIPQHEPWGRIMMDKGTTDNDSGNSHVLELDYTDPLVGEQELDELVERGPYWRR